MGIEKHLSYFKVRNFKSFNSLELNDIGQFNLIVGDNNVGKTSILEALLFDSDVHHLLERLRHVFNNRNNNYFVSLNYNKFNFLENFINKRANNKLIKFELGFAKGQHIDFYTFDSIHFNNASKDEVALLSAIDIDRSSSKFVARLKKENGGTQICFTDYQSDESYYSPILFYNLGYAVDLANIYSTQFQPSKELKEALIIDLNLFIEDINDIEISQDSISNEISVFIRLNDIDQMMPLSMFGDGAIKLFRILLEIQVVRGGRLMIDEIDTGIHYSRFKDFWKTIIKAALKNDVQLFATTHNLECLKYFKEALEESDLEKAQVDARHFLVSKLISGETKAYTYNFEQFESAIELGNEIRGGK